MSETNKDASADIPFSTEDEARDEPVSPRQRMPHLLQRPFDIRSFALSGIFVLALFYTMYFTRAVLLPVVLALLLSFLLAPFVRALKRVKIPTPLGAAIILVTLIAILGYGISFLVAPVAGWLEKAPYGLQQLQHKLLPLQKPMKQVAQASGEIEKLAQPGPAPVAQVEVKQHRMNDILVGRTPELLASAVLLLIMLYFLLAHDGVFLAKVIKMTPRLKDKKRAVSIAHEIEKHVSRYLLTVTLINISLGILVGAIVGLLGLQNPIMWGVLVAVVNFVPYFGALTGIVCMMIGAVLSFDSLGYAMILCVAASGFYI